MFLRKKDIYGNYVKKANAKYRKEIRPLSGKLCGYSAMIWFTTGNEEFFVDCDDEQVCMVADGYKWLMVLPINQNWCLTAMYDTESNPIEFYFDVSKNNFLDENGTPCIDDLYLDIVLFPHGNIVLLDENELLEGLTSGVITKDDYDFAYAVCEDLKKSEWMDVNYVSAFCESLLNDYELSI